MVPQAHGRPGGAGRHDYRPAGLIRRRARLGCRKFRLNRRAASSPVCAPAGRCRNYGRGGGDGQPSHRTGITRVGCLTPSQRTRCSDRGSWNSVRGRGRVGRGAGAPAGPADAPGARQPRAAGRRGRGGGGAAGGGMPSITRHSPNRPASNWRARPSSPPWTGWRLTTTTCAPRWPGRWTPRPPIRPTKASGPSSA